MLPPVLTATLDDRFDRFPRSRMPSQAMLDKVAEAIMTRGYTKKRNPVCTTCHVQKSISGSCCE